MSILCNVVRFDKLRSMLFSSITNSYSPLGFNGSEGTPAPFTHAMRVLTFQNSTDGNIFVSFDGVNTNLFIPANSFSLYDLTSDQDVGESFRYQNRTQIYIQYSTVPTTGSFYVSAVYGLGE